MFKFGPKYIKLKTDLQLACNRLRILQVKKTELSEKMKKEIANYLAEGKYAKAKVKVQTVLRNEASVEAMELIEMFCEQVLDRYGMFEEKKELDLSLVQIITSLIWVAPYMQSEVTELKKIGKQLAVKYGHRFTRAALKNKQKTVSPELIKCVKLLNFPENKIYQSLQEIAHKHQIPKENTSAMEQYFLNAGHGGKTETKSEGKFGNKKQMFASTALPTDEKQCEDVEIFEEDVACDSDTTVTSKRILNEMIKSHNSEPKTDFSNQHFSTDNIDKNNSETPKSTPFEIPKESNVSFRSKNKVCELKKCNHYVSEISFETLYPDPGCICCCDINSDNGVSNQKSKTADGVKMIDQNVSPDFKKETDVSQINEIYDNEIEEPPPPYDTVVYVAIPNNSNPSKADINEPDDSTKIDFCPALPSCPSELLDEVPDEACEPLQ